MVFVINNFNFCHLPILMSTWRTFFLMPQILNGEITDPTCERKYAVHVYLPVIKHANMAIPQYPARWDHHLSMMDFPLPCLITVNMFVMAERAVILSGCFRRYRWDQRSGEIPQPRRVAVENEVQSIHNVFYFAGKVMLSIPSWACLRKVNPSYVNSSVEVVITPWNCRCPVTTFPYKPIISAAGD